MWALIAYVVLGFLTMLGQAIVERRAGDPDWAWWLIVWPFGLMWPFCIGPVACDLIDGPYRPRHRMDYW